MTSSSGMDCMPPTIAGGGLSPESQLVSPFFRSNHRKRMVHYLRDLLPSRNQQGLPGVAPSQLSNGKARLD
jgi:hypothetical protein